MDDVVHPDRNGRSVGFPEQAMPLELPGSPRISIIMANFRGASHLAQAIDSVLAQTFSDFELIVIDDCSPDGSIDIVERYRERDARVRLVALERNVGPAAARNRGIDVARGEWLGIVDNDDLIHPLRLRFLLDAAIADGADIVADDLLIFHDDAQEIATMLPVASDQPFWVDPASFIRSNVIYASRPSLGYCKPLIRRRALGRIRYDESLRIGEDFDFLLRLMVTGSKFRIYPELLYFYRKHSGSISHRFNEDNSRRLIDAETRAMRDHAALGAEVAAAHAERLHSLRRAATFAVLVQGMKARSPSVVLRAARASPSALWLLRLPIRAFVRRRFRMLKPRADAPLSDRNGVMVLSRQRIAGATNGSSAYLISIARFLREHGCSVTYLSPSPTTFGRWPFLRIVEDTRTAFDRFVVRGSVRIGDYLVVLDPKVWVRALLSVLEDRLLRAGFVSHRRIASAPYAISQPLTRQDCLFLARHARGGSDALLLDYAFLAHARPYALRPEAQALIVMHDLFSSRQLGFDKIRAQDSVALLEAEEEYGLLAQASGVIAIQSAEAEAVRTHLPGQSVILAPMAVSVADASAPGDTRTLLFVGSNTAPNVIGIKWFLSAVWPAVRTRCPDARLQIAGSVARSLIDLPEGVICLGVVPDLGPIYRAAAIVISPLTLGSGLKIKLIEAMGFGKAIVATSVTVDGVEAEVQGAVMVADEPDAFAVAVIRLLTENRLRADLAEAALVAAREAFVADICYAPILSALLPSTDARDRHARVQVC